MAAGGASDHAAGHVAGAPPALRGRASGFQHLPKVPAGPSAKKIRPGFKADSAFGMSEVLTILPDVATLGIARLSCCVLARFRQPRTRTDMLQRSRGVCSHTAHNPGCKMLEALPAFLRCSPSPRGRDRPESARCWCAACWCRTCQVPGFADLASRAALQSLALPLRPRDCSMHSRQLLLLL